MSTPLYGEKIVAYIRLARPANIITAVSDILAGVSVSGIFITAANHFTIPQYQQILWLVLSTSCLYGGGIVFNDVFDTELDNKERPERPIPRGLATVKGAIILGILLFVLGIFSAYQVSFLSAGIAFSIAILSLAYDSFFKHHFLGPLNMGLCRAANLFLGISICNEKLQEFWFLGVAPLMFISAITMTSRGEVHGASKNNLLFALGLFLVVSAILFLYRILPAFNLSHAVIFIVLFSGLTILPLAKAIREPSAEKIRTAVQYGILSLVLMNASLAAGFAGVEYGIFVACLLPVSISLSRIFAIT